MAQSVRIAGVGMIPFTKPGQSEPYYVMGSKAAHAALKDAGIDYAEVQQAFVGYVYGDSTAGQTALYELGCTGIPITNLNNNCSTGSTALFHARQAVEAGIVDVALALGFEQMNPGALGVVFNDRPNPMSRFNEEMAQLQGSSEAPLAAQYFGGAGHEYASKYGTPAEVFGMISVKARKHAAENPYALFRGQVTLEEVMASKPVYAELTRLQCCPPTCGAAAAVIVSESYAKRKGLSANVEIVAQAMTTDYASTFESHSMAKLIGYDMSRKAADAVYEKSGVGPQDVPVVELHDCFTANELLTYEALRLTAEGTAEAFIRDGQNTYGGRVVTNPSGGLLSKGHPLGATGLAQCTELVWQLRGMAEKRQVEGARHALQHNLGLGGACVVTMYASV
jgi:acetyl-CoA acetyltransferase